MKIPKYWAKCTLVVESPNGETFKLTSWQWSDTGPEEAQERAAVRLNELVGKVMSETPLNSYGYGDRALREEIVQGYTNAAGQEHAVVTVNRYGALVLNTANVMFIDIDLDQSGPPFSLNALFKKLLGIRENTVQQDPLQGIAGWSNRNPGVGMRVYRTAAGLRVLMTNALFAPSQNETRDLLREFKCDPLYIQLCRVQDCFRARLTPKPWRCGMKMPPAHYPFDDTEQLMQFRDWAQRYELASLPYSVCQLVQTFGPTRVHPDIQPILDVHDRLTGVHSPHPLA